MHLPDSLATLVAQGIIADVLRPLRSGKEAQIYLVVAGGEERVAKIYKDAESRSFKHRSDYMEGRGVRSSRDQRARNKHTAYGRSMDEAAWKSAEVEFIYKLSAAGVRVPEPFQFIDGVLIMELVQDADGLPAPRLAETELTPAAARAVFDQLLQEVVRMVSAGVVHGDLSDFNVLMGASGPVVIDFPQAVDAARNRNARELLIRDVDNLTRFIARFEPGMKDRPYGQEIWQLYERGELRPDTPLTGRWRPAEGVADPSALLEDIEALKREEQRRRAALGLPPIGGKKGAPPPPPVLPPIGGKKGPPPAPPVLPKGPTPEPRHGGSEPAPRKKRRRGGRGRGGSPSANSPVRSGGR